MDIQLLDMHQDTGDSTFKANKKINHNLAQISPNVRLLPEHPTDPNVKGMSFLKYLSLVNETIHHNSLLIGFDYSLLEKNFGFAHQATEKIYRPIAEYFEKLTAN